MPIAHLHQRAVIAIEGEDAEAFLQNIVTCDLSAIPPGGAQPGALLSPQGKILFDFLVWNPEPGSLLLDCAASLAEDFVRRLTLYKLRARAAISKRDQAVVAVSWGIESDSSRDAAGLRDLRFPEALDVRRRYREPFPGPDTAEADWNALRVEYGVAESGSDFAAGDAFPHDVLYDENGGVGFRKGCYIGQEVVSRMQHRGTARRRVMVASGLLPGSGAQLLANGRVLGSLGTVVGQRGLAIVRIDRLRDAIEAGHPITAGDALISLAVPRGARFRLPEPGSPANDNAG